MAVARVRLVVGIVAGQPDEEALVGRFELDRAAPRPDILVVIVDAEVEVVAETAARQPRTRYPDLEPTAARRRTIGQATCRERVWPDGVIPGGAVTLKKKTNQHTS